MSTNIAYLTGENNMHDKQALFERAAEVKAELLSRIESSLSYLLPNGTFHGGKFYVGNIRGDRGKSLVVEIRGDTVLLVNKKIIKISQVAS
ncbi:hypothetical protein [Wolbachia endosymbiont (group A) of Sphaerophoria taeniata]|uniref:hypothetical protein n=1 Tax=Wolbachia endosymbiont (group A) of Sphaerophoria taeniata TaxID=2954057 RepID=UPI002226DF4D|nr:hypothetical protein [Wolbachia endosymbiont (group A) of Sphaerophoria taeniata]